MQTENNMTGAVRLTFVHELALHAHGVASNRKPWDVRLIRRGDFLRIGKAANTYVRLGLYMAFL
jgi:hypothetical protein